jgi:hypothetical protein
VSGDELSQAPVRFMPVSLTMIFGIHCSIKKGRAVAALAVS